MKKLSVVLIGIGLVALLIGSFFWFNNFIYNEKQAGETENLSEVASYFQERMVTLGVKRVGQPIEGFDAMLLMMAFAGLVPQDFQGVETYEGHYEVEGEEVKFVSADPKLRTSAESTVSDKGYATLLENLALRLSVPAMDKSSVDEIVSLISANEKGKISIALGEQGETLGVRIKVLSLLEDSRCPNSVNCIQAGTVRVRATLESGLGTADQVFELNQPITTEAETVTLTEVDPWPHVDQQIEETDYIFHFDVKERKQVEVPEPNGVCYVGGCSSQVCSDQPDVATTCEYRSEYACYKKATCERQVSGECGWTETEELQACLLNSKEES